VRWGYTFARYVQRLPATEPDRLNALMADSPCTDERHEVEVD